MTFIFTSSLSGEEFFAMGYNGGLLQSQGNKKDKGRFENRINMHIDDYSFGRIVINNKAYTSDVIVYPERVEPSWWRKEGHYLQEIDLSEIVSAKPDILIIGTGNSGIMQVPTSTKDFLESNRIKVYIEKTEKAVEIFNKQPKDKKIIGAFHLTC